MKTYYGLQIGDVIIEYGAAGSMMKVRETNDAELAKAMVAEAYQRHQPLTVLRNGAPVKLDGEEKKPRPRAPQRGWHGFAAGSTEKDSDAAVNS